jgi:hypothetical protein
VKSMSSAAIDRLIVRIEKRQARLDEAGREKFTNLVNFFRSAGSLDAQKELHLRQIAAACGANP